MENFRTWNGHFQITFPNGVTVSIFNGAGSYSSNHDAPFQVREDGNKPVISDTSEIAAFKKNHEWVTKDIVPDVSDDVIGWKSPVEVLDFMTKASQLK